MVRLGMGTVGHGQSSVGHDRLTAYDRLTAVIHTVNDRYSR